MRETAASSFFGSKAVGECWLDRMPEVAYIHIVSYSHIVLTPLLTFVLIQLGGVSTLDLFLFLDWPKRLRFLGICATQPLCPALRICAHSLTPNTIDFYGWM